VRGGVEGVKGYHDITRYPEARLIPGLVLFRWDAPLFFANAELFHERVLDAVASSPTPVRWLVVAAEPVTSVDVTAADAVSELDDTLRAARIELYFAEMKDPVKDKLKRFGLFARFGERTFFATLGEAVSAYLATPRLIGSTGRIAGYRAAQWCLSARLAHFPYSPLLGSQEIVLHSCEACAARSETTDCWRNSP
jgi:hypothetical protein